ncbi:hypothetical protein TCAL_00575 [Tigriopus californicus]|uniref:RRM domain-containing protein n=1 Tax=Tigriopus californicus TaxID=6832 RepID=A0A553PAE0_TIGCA|nr:hypothetical protein TCAL_00575 [Tigriopus californicus]|eukprot:TCALIF_00575-PA protein Name:"Protein of unknown function" AED:0.11 eAED:0.11 QI:0/0.5/0.33/1/0.5/0.66/3/278/920
MTTTSSYRPTERQVYVHLVPKGYTNDLIRKGLPHWPAIEEVYHKPNTSWANITLKSAKAQKEVLSQPVLHVLDGQHKIHVKPFNSGGIHPQDTWYASSPNPNENEMSDACKLFVGGIPYDFDEEDVRKAIHGWGKVVHVSIPPSHGAAFITFATPEDQRRALKDKDKHKIGHKFVDVKPYVSKPGRGSLAVTPGLLGAVPKASQGQTVLNSGIMSQPTGLFKANANVRERAASQAPDPTPRTQRRKRNQSASQPKKSVASESTEINSSENEAEQNPEKDKMLSEITDLSLNRDDLMRYLAKIRTIKEFLQEHFSQASEDNILSLAQKIMQVDVKKRQIISNSLISRFIKVNHLNIGEQKRQNIMALFKVLLHPFAQETEMDGKVAEKMADREHMIMIHKFLNNATPTPSTIIGQDMSGVSSQIGSTFSKTMEVTALLFESVSLDSIDSFSLATEDNTIPKFNAEARRKYQDIYDWVTHYYKTVKTSESFKADDVGKAIVNSLSNASLDKQEIVNDKKLFLAEPLVILGKYARFVDAYFNPHSHLVVSREFVIKALALYFWNTNPFIAELAGNDPKHPTLSSILSATVISKSMLANVRGIVIHFFNTSVGLVVTPFGKVLFDIRSALTRSNQDWIRCTHQNQLSVGSMVKLHCIIVEDNEDKKMTFLVAFKLWPIAVEEEPYTGLWIAGGSEFWKASLGQLIKLVKANPELMFTTKIDQNRKKDDVDLYNKCFEHFMRKAFDELKTSSAVSRANLEITEPTFKTAIAFFQKRIDDASWLTKAVNTVKQEKITNLEGIGPTQSVTQITPSESTPTKNVKVVLEGHREIYSFPLSEDGNLSVSFITAIFPTVSCLIYVQQSTGHIRVCAKSGNIFSTPEDGWGNRIYTARILAAPPQYMNGIPPFQNHSNAQSLFGQSFGLLR